MNTSASEWLKAKRLDSRSVKKDRILEGATTIIKLAHMSRALWLLSEASGTKLSHDFESCDLGGTILPQEKLSSGRASEVARNNLSKN